MYLGFFLNASGFKYSASRRSLNVLNATIIMFALHSRTCLFIGLLAELGLTQLESTVLYADNKSMVTLCTEYSGNHKRAKHYLNRINFMLRNVITGAIR